MYHKLLHLQPVDFGALVDVGAGLCVGTRPASVLEPHRVWCTLAFSHSLAPTPHQIVVGLGVGVER